ncbi:MAG: sulfate transporter, inner rane subunit CysT [Actinomycetia bacterium]|nr:sulfate transporter, inner rane subunit CysT [Actinomycetes bacterium]
MSQLAVDAARLPRARGRALGRPALSSGLALGYLSVIVLVPLAALSVKGAQGGWHHFWQVAWNPESKAALELTLGLSLAVVAINAITGTALAWTLVRDDFPGKGIVNTLIDLPFALPTIVAGLTLLALYGPTGGVGVNVAYTRWGVLLALLFVTLPFVVRTVQPVLIELDREMEEAAASLGANKLTIFRRIVFPHLLPALLSGVALAFARAIGEFGAVILISGNLPFKTEVASLYVFQRLNSGDEQGAAALAVLLLVISLGVLLGIGGVRRWAVRHDR